MFCGPLGCKHICILFVSVCKVMNAYIIFGVQPSKTALVVFRSPDAHMFHCMFVQISSVVCSVTVNALLIIAFASLLCFYVFFSRHMY